MNPNYSTDLAARIAGETNYRVLEFASAKAKSLAATLRGGRKASPNVDLPLKLATELLAWLQAVHDRFPDRQRSSDTITAPATLTEDCDLSTLIGAISRDARYLAHLTQGGIGMTPNVVEPLRVLAELTAKMEAVQDRWPELQGPYSLQLSPVRRFPGSSIVDELIASGELPSTRDPGEADPLDKLIADVERRGGVRRDHV